ncbi:MAG: hypothetical protein HQL60_09010 [Magnetococcales bacterium]|nr:hypothetical protein [Magnetococcales bacterium]
MGQLVLYDVDDGLIDRLRRYAETHRYSLEEMLTEIIVKAIPSKITEASGESGSCAGFESNAGLEPNGTRLAYLARSYADAELVKKFGDPVEWQRAQRRDRHLLGRED